MKRLAIPLLVWCLYGFDPDDRGWALRGLYPSYEACERQDVQPITYEQRRDLLKAVGFKVGPPVPMPLEPDGSAPVLPPRPGLGCVELEGDFA